MTSTIDDWIDYGYQRGWIRQARCLTHSNPDTLADMKKPQETECIYTLELSPIERTRGINAGESKTANTHDDL